MTKEDYESCNGRNPIQKYDDGRPKIELNQKGIFYFIGGAEGFCENGQKLAVVASSQSFRRLGAWSSFGKIITEIP